MTKKIAHIIRWVSGIFLTLLTVINTLAQDGAKPVPFFEITQCDTLHLQIEDMPGDDYTWDIYSNAGSDFASTQGDMESAVYFLNGDYRDVSSVDVINLPPGEYFVKVTAWDEVQCTNNLMVFRMDVIEPPPPTLESDPVCVGEVPVVRIIFTGSGPWEFSYSYSDGVTTVNGNGSSSIDDYTMPIVEPLPEGEYTFWILEVVDGCAIAREYTGEERPNTGILIYPKPTKQPIYLKEND